MATISQTAKKTSDGSRGAGCFLILFGGFFAAMGGFGLYSILNGTATGETGVGGMLIAGVFMLIGLGIVFGGFYALTSAGRTSKLARQYPGQPWMHRKNWASGRIKDSNLGTAIAISIFALIWNGISWTAVIGLISEGTLEKEPAAYFVFLFPLIGLGIIWGAVYQIIRYRKFGSSVFELAEIPGVIGGNLGGLVLTKVNLQPASGFHLTLRCIHKWTTGSGKNSSTHRETLWESEQVLKEEAMPEDTTRSALPVLFFIPYTCRETERISSRAEIYWELEAKADLPGADYKATFIVPVFKTEASNPDATAESSQAKLDNTENAPLPALSEIKGLNVRGDFSGGELLEFRSGRNFLFLLIPVMIGSGFTVGGVFMFTAGDMPFIFPLAFAGIGSIVTLACLASLFTATRILLFKDRIEVHKRTLGRSKTQVARRDQIERIDAKQGMSSGNVVFYNIEIYTQAGERIDAPTLIKGRRHADALIAYLQKS